MALEPTQFGSNVTQMPDLQSAVTPQAGVAERPVLLEGIGRLFDQASAAFQQAGENRSQAAVADFVKQQTLVADALAQGNIKSSEHARTIMRKNFLAALDANPTLWKELSGAHGAIIGTPGLGQVAATGTEEEQRMNARKDALVSAGQLSFDADQETFELVDANVRMAEEAERQHQMRMRTIDEQLKQGQLNKQQAEAEREQANTEFFRQAAPVEMNHVQTEFEKILNSPMSEAEKLVALDDFYAEWNNRLSSRFGQASEREGSAFKKPFDMLYESYQKRVTGELTNEELKRQNERVIQTQKAIALSDPTIARLAVTSELFGSQGMAEVVARGDTSVFKAYTDFLAGGDPANGRTPPTLFNEEPEKRRASGAYLKDISRGLTTGNEAQQEESARRLESAMQSVVDDGNRLRRNPKSGIELVNYMASSEFFAARKARPDLFEGMEEELRDTLARNYDDEVWGMVSREFTNSSIHFSPERIGSRGAEDVPVPEGIQVRFANGSVRFIPTNPNNSNWKMEADRLNKDLAPVINNTIKAGAHLEGHNNYEQVWEQAAPMIFGEEALQDADVGDDLELADFTFPKISSATLPSDVQKDQAFLDEVNVVAEKHGISSSDLMAVMDFETGGTFSPSQANAAGSSATGLIQFMAATARDLGTSTEELASMSRAEQMRFVDKYLSQFDLAGKSTADVYMAVLFPKAVGKPDDYVLFRQGTTAYTQNRGLDRNRNGFVTKAEAARDVVRRVGKYSTNFNQGAEEQSSAPEPLSMNPTMIEGSIERGLEPFDPNKHKPRDIGLGGESTEYLITVQDSEGQWVNIPSIWWNRNGDPILLDEDTSRQLALRYEESIGGQFPRFSSVEEAEEWARKRSSKGGASVSSLIKR